jgi:hypothetical protein
MSLVQGYSSSDEDVTTETLKDAFNLAAVSSTKRLRVQQSTPVTIPQAAPDVLAEVSSFLSLFLSLFFCDANESKRIRSTKHLS